MTPGEWARAWLWEPPRNTVGNVLSIVDQVIDWVWFRFDLWKTPPRYEDNPHHIDYGKKITRGEADFSKVRGFFLYVGAIVVLLIVVLTSKTLPAQLLRDVLCVMFVLAMGERVAVAIAKAWGSRRAGDTPAAGMGDVVMKEIEERRASVGGDHEPTTD